MGLFLHMVRQELVRLTALWEEIKEVMNLDKVKKEASSQGL